MSVLCGANGIGMSLFGSDRPWTSLSLNCRTALWSWLAVTPTAFIAAWLYFHWSTRSARSLSDIQKAHFPLGSLLNWTDLLWVNRRILAEADPKTGLCVQWLGSSRAWAVTKAEHVDKVLQKSVSRGGDAHGLATRMAMVAGTFHIKMFMGWNSVGILEGRQWKEVRGHLGKFVQSTQHLKLQFEPIKEAANHLIAYFIKHQDQDSQEVSEPLFAMAYDCLSNAVFGEPAHFLRGLVETGEVHPVVHALADTMVEMTRRMGSFNPLDWLYIFDAWRPSQRRFVESQRIVWTYVKEIVERRKKDQTESFLYHLAQAATDAVVYDNVQTCMWAGHESTAASLSFILHELSTRPDIQQKLREEVRGVVGVDGELKYEHMLGKLPYVNACVDEALRLHPPAIWTNRELEMELDLDGTKLPVGSPVFVPIVAVHRSPLNWDDPDEFRPERFYNTKVAEGAHVPLGAGRRICPGHKLAPFELKVTLATLAHRGLHVERRPEDPQPTVRANGAFQLCLDNKLVLSFTS